MRVILPGTGRLRENEDRDIVPLRIRFAPEWDPVVQATVGITLSATVRARGSKAQVNLTWDPADGGNMNVLRNGAIVQTTADDGSTKDNLRNASGSTFTYQVCETDSGDC